MRIAELSPDFRSTTSATSAAAAAAAAASGASNDPQSHHPGHLLSDLESSVKSLEHLSPSLEHLPETLTLNLRTTLSLLSSHPFSDSTKLQIWKLSYRLWNACVDLTNALQNPSQHQNRDEGCDRDRDLANLRQIASDLLFLAGNPTGIPNPELKSASFFYKTGLIWHDLKKFDLASSCFEKATDLISTVKIDQIRDDEEKKLLLDLNLARSRTAWETSDRNLVIALLNRSKNLIFGSPAAYKVLAEHFLQFGKLDISKNCTDASKLLTEALDLCEKGILASKTLALTVGLEALKAKCLRFLAADRLQAEDFEGVLKCVKVLRSEKREGKEHPSISYIALKAWMGLGRVLEAEKELKGMMGNSEVPENVIVSAAELYLSMAGIEAAMSVLMGLVGRCRAGAGAALRVVRRVAEGGGGGRAKVVAELAADERVVAVFEGTAAAKERSAMHAILWNHGAEHFRLKEYEIGALMFEKSMLYIPRDEENRSRRSNCFRVLCLCHLALAQLDRAQEFIDQAEKLEPNIRSTFLKFKIHLQKKDEKEAISQIQAMVSCIDFNPEYLTLSTHEAIACQSLSVAISALSLLLNLYSPGKEMPMPEVAVLRNLITLLHRSPKAENEILKYTRRARAKMTELGVESFFGKGAVGGRELSWFAGESWNMGLKMAKEKMYDLSAEFLELASEFYSEICNENGETQLMLCKALIVSVGAMINSEGQKKVPLPESNVRKGMGMLSRAGKLLPSVSGGDQEADASSLVFLHTFNTYHLLNRLDDAQQQQLQVIKSFASSKACTPHSLFQLGFAAAAQDGRTNPEAAEFALNACLSALLACPSPDYQMVGTVLRRLARLTGLLGKDDITNDGAFGVYRQAYQIIVGLKEGEYPIEEGKWLATTAWNKGGMALRVRQVEVARRWMKMGLDLARQVRGMEKYTEGMEETFANFEKTCNGGGVDDRGASWSRPEIILQ